MAKDTWTKADQCIAMLDRCAAAGGAPVEICRVNDPDLGILVKGPDGPVLDSAFLDKLTSDSRFPAGGRVVVEDYIGNPQAAVLVVSKDADEKAVPFQPDATALPAKPTTVAQVAAILAANGLCKP